MLKYSTLMIGFNPCSNFDSLNMLFPSGLSEVKSHIVDFVVEKIRILKKDVNVFFVIPWLWEHRISLIAHTCPLFPGFFIIAEPPVIANSAFCFYTSRNEAISGSLIYFFYGGLLHSPEIYMPISFAKTVINLTSTLSYHGPSGLSNLCTVAARRIAEHIFLLFRYLLLRQHNFVNYY